MEIPLSYVLTGRSFSSACISLQETKVGETTPSSHPGDYIFYSDPLSNQEYRGVTIALILSDCLYTFSLQPVAIRIFLHRSYTVCKLFSYSHRYSRKGGSLTPSTKLKFSISLIDCYEWSSPTMGRQRCKS